MVSHKNHIIIGWETVLYCDSIKNVSAIIKWNF